MGGKVVTNKWEGGYHIAVMGLPKGRKGEWKGLKGPLSLAKSGLQGFRLWSPPLFLGTDDTDFTIFILGGNLVHGSESRVFGNNIAVDPNAPTGQQQPAQGSALGKGHVRKTR